MPARVVVVPGGRRRGGWLNLAVAAVIFAGILWATHGHLPAFAAKPQAGAAATTQARTDASLNRTAAAAKAVAWAGHQIGKPYIYGGPTKPGTGAGFDCSGLTFEAWQTAGTDIGRTSEDQWAKNPHVTRSQLKPGDLVFEAGGDLALDPWPGHVYLYIGHGKGVEAYAPGFPVRYITVRWADAVGFARPGGRP